MIAWCVGRLQGATWEWLLVVPVFVFSNLFEWWIHKNVMHRLVDVWALRAIYDRHTRQHHQYFTDNEMTVDSTREWRIIFFPWRALFTFMALGVPFALALALARQPERRLHPDGDDRRPVPDLRDLPLLLPRARQLVRAHMRRSSTPSAATTRCTTTRAS